MSKITKKEQIENLQAVVAAQWRQINKLKLHLGRLVDIDWSDEQANHDEVIAILNNEQPKPKTLDQSVFDGLDKQWQWAAFDNDGCRHVYLEKPRCGSYWEHSLIERESKELTGSDLCRAMLDKGFEYVMCLVGDECEESASNSETVRVVCSRGADYFDDTTEDMWYFAIPINNQGEPLTASEVGL